MASTHFFYQLMGTEIGPISAAELKARAADGTITPDTFIRQGEGGEWVAAERAKGLFPTTSAADADFWRAVGPMKATAAAVSVQGAPPTVQATPSVQPVRAVITAIDVPTLSLVVLMVRLAIATIPAAIILAVPFGLGMALVLSAWR